MMKRYSYAKGGNKTINQKTIRKTPLLQRIEWDHRHWPPDTQDGQHLWSTFLPFPFSLPEWRERVFLQFSYPISKIIAICHAETSCHSSKGSVSSSILTPYSFESIFLLAVLTCLIMRRLSCSCASMALQSLWRGWRWRRDTSIKRFFAIIADTIRSANP